MHATYNKGQLLRSLAKISSALCLTVIGSEGAAQYLTESGRKAARLNAQVSFILCFTF